MENQAATTGKYALKFGLLLGLISILYNVVLYVMGMHMEQNLVNGLIGIVIMIVFIIYGIREFKKANGNILSTGQALKTGVGIALVAGVISVIYTMILMNFIEPDMMSQILEKQQEAMIESNPNMTQDQLDAALAMSEKFSSPAIISAMALIWSVILGFIISLIGGLIMKREA
ncbi:DUF4199 domain-containing protein [Lacinutrix iliipiscaria]|uniref:DUF4199 domain-containing protein n=1 Tax=Lacinutrix iliipiscaria TaxID=1230532 RepID=A0ABW5WP90_9FLAO